MQVSMTRTNHFNSNHFKIFNMKKLFTYFVQYFIKLARKLKSKGHNLERMESFLYQIKFVEKKLFFEKLIVPVYASICCPWKVFIRVFVNLRHLIKIDKKDPPPVPSGCSEPRRRNIERLLFLSSSNHQRCSIKKVFLKISQTSQENTCSKCHALHKCFFVDLAKILKALLQNYLRTSASARLLYSV